MTELKESSVLPVTSTEGLRTYPLRIRGFYLESSQILESMSLQVQSFCVSLCVHVSVSKSLFVCLYVRVPLTLCVCFSLPHYVCFSGSEDVGQDSNVVETAWSEPRQVTETLACVAVEEGHSLK